MKRLILTLCLITICFAESRHSKYIAKQSNDQFEKTLHEKLPSNGLINGANKKRGIAAMHRMRNFVSRNGCNIRLCFALDAGIFVSKDEYVRQQDFALLIAAIGNLDSRFRVAGVQYGLRTVPLSFLTADVEEFISSVAESSPLVEDLHIHKWTAFDRWYYFHIFRRLSRHSFRRALRFCKLVLPPTSKRNADKIFFLGDLQSPRAGVSVARRFRAPPRNGQICAAVFGKGDKNKLVRFTGSTDRIINIENTEGALDLLEKTVKDVCGAASPQ